LIEELHLNQRVQTGNPGKMVLTCVNAGSPGSHVNAGKKPRSGGVPIARTKSPLDEVYFEVRARRNSLHVYFDGCKDHTVVIVIYLILHQAYSYDTTYTN
jgi:hypothetical protein